MWRNSLLIVSAATGLAATQLPVWATGGKGAATPVLPDVVPTRSQQLSRLRDNSVDKPFDVLIIGGGATGTGCAVDATLRCTDTNHDTTAHLSEQASTQRAFPRLTSPSTLAAQALTSAQ